MSWMGKAVGSAAGNFLFGTPGIRMGYALGSLVDLWLEAGEEEAISADDREVVLRASFLSQLAAKIGRFETTERALIVELSFLAFAGKGRLSPEAVQAKLDEWSADEELRESVFGIAKAVPEWRHMLLHFACRVGSKRGTMRDYAVLWVKNANQEMGGSDSEINAILTWYRRGPEDDTHLSAERKLLNVKPDASLEELQRCYRAASLAYHPDRHMSVDSHLRDLAAERFRQISAAYSLLVEHIDSYFGLAECSTRLQKAEERGVVRCFGCRQRCRLPGREQFVNVRCPKCQRLLVFREELATTCAQAAFGS